jgi:signal transduction histidine kinase/CheY-like chemotaxis protein
LGNGTPSLRPAARDRAAKSPEDRVVGAVYTEQIAAVFRQMPIALAVNLINAAVVAVVLMPIVVRPLPLIWFGIVALVTIGRGIVWWRYRRAGTADNARGWSIAAIGGALFAGLSWGLGGALLFPIISPLAQLFLTIVIGGMCTGAVVLSASHLPTLLAFLLAASLPVAARFVAEGAPTDTALGAMIAIFAAAMTLAGTHLNRIFVNAMRLRFELNEANQRLHAEMAEHRATEAALRQAQKLEAIGHLTGGIAHDFNNLLTIVIGNLFLASERLGGNSAVAPLIEGAMQATERGVALIQRLLSFARRQRLDPRPVDLCHLLADINNMLLQTLGSQIQLIVNAPADLAPAEVDAAQLELAILNLAINARDAMPQGGALRITLTNRHLNSFAPRELADGDYVVIEMADTGIGMDEATLGQAFDPFFTTKDVGVGTGLGLPMVQRFAAQSRGAVRLSSQLGAGTSVELWLPKADSLPAVAPAASPPGPEAARKDTRILLCDDDDGVRRFIGDYLNSIGYSVCETSRASAALRVLDGDAVIDLLIVDYAMPGINGIETIRQARRRRPGLKALLITGHSAAEQGHGADFAILQKPFSPADLAREVNRICEMFAGRQC